MTASVTGISLSGWLRATRTRLAVDLFVSDLSEGSLNFMEQVDSILCCYRVNAPAEPWISPSWAGGHGLPGYCFLPLGALAAGAGAGLSVLGGGL